MDLHGNSKKKERNPYGTSEENVFDIQQGVSIFLGASLGKTSSPPRVEQVDVWGNRSAKYDSLTHIGIHTSSWISLSPKSPKFLLVPQDEVLSREYEQFLKVTDIFSVNGDPAPGIVTTQDQFAIAFTEDEIIRNVEALLSTQSEAEARAMFRLCSQAQWNYDVAMKELRDGQWRRQVGMILYRPFDVRWTVYNKNVAVHRRERVMRHMLGLENVALLTARSNRSPAMDHFFCSRLPTETKCGESTIQSYLLPLYLLSNDKSDERQGVLPGTDAQRSNISDQILLDIKAMMRPSVQPLSPEDVFHYAYAVFHSPTFRLRYAQFLKLDFPRLPIPKTRDMFAALSSLGAELMSLHLLESQLLDLPLTSYVGPARPVIDRVDWSEDTVWLDAPSPKKGQAAIPGSVGFRGVSAEIWNFQVGGYQVCEKWLKYRRGRTLSVDDLLHYQKVVMAIAKTLLLEREIDNIIESRGGWSGAFHIPWAGM